MGRGAKRALPAVVAGGPKERYKRVQRSQYDPNAPVPEGFVAKPAIPKSRHHTYLEFVENTEKKKKLEVENTIRKTPPPGFEFVPIGNPQLTTACKELSRAKDAMVFLVSARGLLNSADNRCVANLVTQNAKEVESSTNISRYVHRVGIHARQTIVEEARSQLLQPLEATLIASNGDPEPIPKSQAEYNAQADAALIDLFPRVPNTDRQLIIEHAFSLTRPYKGEKPVGLAADITLARRVQLAVLAHIRHTHTTYDELLKKTTWQNARKVVESLCLDILVKWRGDEETGRDQLDEILREVVVISDTESGGSDDEDEGESSSIEEVIPQDSQITLNHARLPTAVQQMEQRKVAKPRRPNRIGPLTRSKSKGNMRKEAKPNGAGNKEQRGFKRYRAWQEAIERNRDVVLHTHPLITDRPVSHGSLPHPPSVPQPHLEAANPPLDEQASRGYLHERGVPDHHGYVGRKVGASQHPYYPDLASITTRHQPAFARDMVGAGSQQLSPRGTPLRDYLVRSIEPASPSSMLPSFVRAVPPGEHGVGPRSPSRPMRGYRSRPDSPAGEGNSREALPYAERRVVSDRAPYQKDPLAHPPHPEPQHPPAIRHEPGRLSFHPRERGLPGLSPVHTRSFSFEPSHGYSGPRQTSPRPIGFRPGERSDPILMEDRGGFFERVSPHRDGNMARLSDAGVIQFHPPVSGEGRPLPAQPWAHRVVSGEEGSRILNLPGAEVIRPPIFPRGSYPQTHAMEGVLCHPHQQVHVRDFQDHRSPFAPQHSRHLSEPRSASRGNQHWQGPQEQYPGTGTDGTQGRYHQMHGTNSYDYYPTPFHQRPRTQHPDDVIVLD